MSFRTLAGGRLNQYRPPQTTTSPPTIFHGVVIDVIYDPKLLTDDDKNDLRQFVSNPEFIDTMPQNTIVARIISNQQSATDTSAALVYPFFQSHLMLPIQAGEQVMIIYDDYSYYGGILGRWITRTPEGYTVEDPNFTHGDRRFDPNNNPGQQDVAQQRARRNEQSSAPRPSFPNGSGTPESYTLRPSNDEPNINPFDTIATDANAVKLHTFEPVPRWTKRPQEFIIQSMNNALIMLGQDRIGPATRPDSNPPDKLKYSGTIDIVAGRGRVPLETGQNSAPDGKETSALTVQNTRNKLETDKTPFIRNRQPNTKEGDPNFKSDAARIYISMNTAGDTNFKLLHSDVSYPDKTLRPEQQSSGPNENVGSSYIIGKADHIRVVARKSTDPEIKGTVLVIKEGTKDTDLAFLYINQDGKVQLEGPEIYFGKATDKDQPYIKYQQYKTTIEHLQSQIDALRDFLNETIGVKLFTAMQGAVAIPFSPVATLFSTAPQIRADTTTIVGNLQGKSQDTPNKINNCKSTKVFGE